MNSNSFDILFLQLKGLSTEEFISWRVYQLKSLSTEEFIIYLHTYYFLPETTLSGWQDIKIK